MKYLTFFLLILSVQTFAENVWHASKVKRVYPQGNGGFILTFMSIDENCNRSDKYHYVTVGQNGVTMDGVKNMLSVALAAGAMDIPLTLYYDKDSAGCYINRMSLDFADR